MSVLWRVLVVGLSVLVLSVGACGPRESGTHGVGVER